MTVANKVVYNGNTLIDLTSDTATADDVMAGETFHLASGAQGVGTLKSAKLGFGFGFCSTCETIGGLSVCPVSIPDYERVEGGIIAVFFDVDVPADAYLDVNEQGATSIDLHFSPLPANVICSGDTAFFTYDGNLYCLLGIDKSASLILDSELTALETKLGL